MARYLFTLFFTHGTCWGWSGLARGVMGYPTGWLDVAGWVAGDVLPRDGGDEGTVGQRVECCAGMRV
jgi:hypothetical protein